MHPHARMGDVAIGSSPVLLVAVGGRHSHPLVADWAACKDGSQGTADSAGQLVVVGFHWGMD